jgi:hypothetical protein
MGFFFSPFLVKYCLVLTHYLLLHSLSYLDYSVLYSSILCRFLDVTLRRFIPICFHLLIQFRVLEHFNKAEIYKNRLAVIFLINNVKLPLICSTYTYYRVIRF